MTEERVWKTGAQLDIKVLDVGSDILIGEHQATGEGFILTGIIVPATVLEGDMVTIIFRHGGPMGGHWDLKGEDEE